MPFLPFIPFLNCVDVFFGMSINGIPLGFTLGVKAPSAIVGTYLNDLETALEGWWGTSLSPLLSTQALMEYIKLTDLTTVAAATLTVTPISPGTGGATGGAAVNSNALGVTFATAQRGRSYRGRNYVPGLRDADLASSTHWSGAVAASVQAAYEQIPTALATVSSSHVVLSRFNDSVRRTIGVATPVTSYRANTLVVSQRRRLT